MIDLESLHTELFGPWDVEYGSDGKPASWTSVSRHTDKYDRATHIYVMAQLSNAVERLTERLDSK